MTDSVASTRAEPVILQQEPTWIALDKPAGWLSHPAGTDAPDLVTWLEQQGHGTYAPVHRLDASTSGVVLFAHPSGVDRWASCFEDGTADKRYQALVFGSTRKKGTIRRPLQDGRRGKPLACETRYKTIKSYGKWSWLDVKPVTGRKHQIRRHLQGIGHAIIGDDRYPVRGKKTVPAFPGRLWLHCRSLALPGLPTFEAPLSPELQAHLDVLEARLVKAEGDRSP